MRRPNFVLAFVLAVLAGGLATFLLSLLVIPFIGNVSERNLKGAATAAALIATYGIALCFAYVLVLGIGIVVYVRATRRVPSLFSTLLLGILAGGIPFIAFPVYQVLQGASPSKFDAYLLPGLAIGAAIAASWIFWTVGLRNRITA